MGSVGKREAMGLVDPTQSRERFLIACSCLVFALLICSCGADKPTVTEAEKKANEKFYQELNEHFAKPNQEIVALLSIKYGIGFDIVETLLDSYLSETDLGYKARKSSIKGVKSSKGDDTADPLKSIMRQKSEYAKILTRVATELQINPVTAASIIIEYKIWSAPTEASKGE